jgi:hypothetical protein
VELYCITCTVFPDRLFVIEILIIQESRYAVSSLILSTFVVKVKAEDKRMWVHNCARIAEVMKIQAKKAINDFIDVRNLLPAIYCRQEFKIAPG